MKAQRSYQLCENVKMRLFMRNCAHMECSEWRDADLTHHRPLSYLTRQKVTDTLKQMVFILLSAVHLQANLGQCSPLKSDSECLVGGRGEASSLFHSR